MRIDILTVVPELLDSPLSHSIVGRAIKNGLVDIKVHNLRKYGVGPRKNVDDYSYGGDAGMVMMVEPVFNMINELKSAHVRIQAARGRRTHARRLLNPADANKMPPQAVRPAVTSPQFNS